MKKALISFSLWSAVKDKGLTEITVFNLLIVYHTIINFINIFLENILFQLRPKLLRRNFFMYKKEGFKDGLFILQQDYLDAFEKLLYIYLENNNNGRFSNISSSGQLAKTIGVSKKKAISCLSSLVKYGLVSELTNEEKVSILKEKNLQGRGIGIKSCEWCKINTFVLEFHHYPVSRSMGGTETVGICAICHREFHSSIVKLKGDL